MRSARARGCRSEQIGHSLLPAVCVWACPEWAMSRLSMVYSSNAGMCGVLSDMCFVIRPVSNDTAWIISRQLSSLRPYSATFCCQTPRLRCQHDLSILPKQTAAGNVTRIQSERLPVILSLHIARQAEIQAQVNGRDDVIQRSGGGKASREVIAVARAACKDVTDGRRACTCFGRPPKCGAWLLGTPRLRRQYRLASPMTAFHQSWRWLKPLCQSLASHSCPQNH